MKTIVIDKAGSDGHREAMRKLFESMEDAHCESSENCQSDELFAIEYSGINLREIYRDGVIVKSEHMNVFRLFS